MHSCDIMLRKALNCTEASMKEKLKKALERALEHLRKPSKTRRGILGSDFKTKLRERELNGTECNKCYIF